MNFENLRAINQTHQPVVVCIDTSASMNEDAGNGITKISACRYSKWQTG